MINQSNRPLRHRNNNRKTFVFALLILLIATAAGVFVGYLFAGFKMPQFTEVMDPAFDGKSKVTVLMLGEDNTGLKGNSRGLSDTIVVTTFDFDNNTIAALSIPRDTKVEIPGHGTQKINASHVIGGPELTMEVVTQLIGLRPDYYLKTNLDGLKQTVDAVGGVEIDVEKNMHYTDRNGGLYINLKKGRQVLDGDKAMQYVRFRHDAMGDIWRTERQQKFMRALASKAIEPGNLSRLPKVVSTALRNVETTMTPKDAVALAKFSGGLDSNRIVTETLAGAPENINGASYWVVDPAVTAETVQRLFVYTNLLFLPKVEVLNGSGVPGVAQAVSDLLRDQGFDVVSTGNAKTYDYGSSEIISHRRHPQDIDKLAKLLYTKTIKEDLDAESKIDMTVIIGKDWLNGPPDSDDISSNKAR